MYLVCSSVPGTFSYRPCTSELCINCAVAPCAAAKFENNIWPWNVSTPNQSELRSKCHLSLHSSFIVQRVTLLFWETGSLLLIFVLLFCPDCMLWSVRLLPWPLSVSCRLLFYGPQPKTDGPSSQKSLLFLCMTRMTSPPSAPSASRRAATSPVVFPRSPCLTSFNPRPPLLPFLLLRPR